MKTIASGFTINAAIASSALLLTACGTTQTDQPSSATDGTASSPAAPGTAPQLPAMSADRCVAEAVGSATDPNTGSPVAAAVDPETGKPLCPPEPPRE